MAKINDVRMKKLFVSALLSLPFFAVAQTISYTIEGAVKNWSGRDTVTLFYVVDGAPKIDTALAMDGKFSFRGSLAEPKTGVLKHQNPTSRLRPDAIIVYLEQGKIEVNAIDSIRYARITAGQLNRDFIIYNSTINPLVEKLAATQKKAMNTRLEDRGSAEFKALNDSFDSISRLIRKEKKAFIEERPASFVSLATLKEIAGAAIDYPAISSLFEQLSPSLKSTPTGKALAKRVALAKTTAIGAVLPNFTSPDTAGKSLSLNEVVSAGKITLVDFWASWCLPCRKENPNVVKAFKAFHDKGLNIISVSLDEKAVNWKYAINKDGMPWYHVSSLKGWDDPVVSIYDINGLPDSFLLDANGTVIARGLRGEALYKAIEDHLEKN